MNLWIRSQDKRIFRKIEYLEVDEVDGIITDDECNRLGTYKSQERALEVLDEIEQILALKIKNETYEKADILIKSKMIPVIYEMPKE